MTDHDEKGRGGRSGSHRHRRTRSSRLPTLSVLITMYYYATNMTTGTTTTTTEASPNMQHRVGRPTRSVPYQHTLEGRNRGVLINSVVHERCGTTINDLPRLPLHRESHFEDDYYVLHAQVPVVPAKQPVLKNSGNSQQDNSNNVHGRRRSLWRHLFDQFVGEEIPPSLDGENSTSSVNVTTEVEITETVVVEGDDSGLPSPDNDNISGVHQEENVSSGSDGEQSTGMSIVGSNITNITETVIYTETKPGPNNTDLSDGSGGELGNGSFNTTGHNETDGNGTVVVETGPRFQPLRMRAILAEKSSSGGGSLLNETERNALFHDMLSPALLAWSSSLRVDPVVGNLTVDVNQLMDGKTCGPGVDTGLPSIQVPVQHLEEGIPNTDLIVYLSLGFVIPTSDTNATNKTSSEDRGSEEEEDEVEQQKGREGGLFAGRGEKGFDFKIKEIWGGLRRLVESNQTMSKEEEQDIPKRIFLQDNEDDEEEEETEEGSVNTTAPINICTGEYLAAASYCSTDQYDRPTAALLHICIDENFFDPKNYRRNTLTLMHELAHALGFNSLSMAHFRRPDGTPYTPRDEDGAIPYTEVECTGPGTEHQFASLALPSEEVLQFREVRGGVRVAEVVTPSVVQVVRNQFDCQLLTGAELESGEGLPLSILGNEGCIGDHWERRLFSRDLMNPIVDDLEYSSRISTLTLAYFADSGWYQVDLSNADVATGWGRGAGCNFVNDTCVSTTTGEVPPQNAPFFCNEISTPTGFSLAPQDIHGCTPDLTRKAKCSIGQYDLDLPAAYQYFNSTYGADVGGSDSLMDFCPAYAGFENGLCSSAESASVIRAFDVERFGQRNSRCLTGNVLPFQRTTALCLPIACVIQDRSFRIEVNNEWYICDEADQQIITQSVVITCPDPRRICPTFFCPYDCLGTGGRCDYQSGQCLCEYEGVYINGEKAVDVCGLELPANATDGSVSSHRPFVQREQQETIDPARPPPDTQLSDYYVDNVDKLRDEPLIMHPWMISVICISGFLLSSLMVTAATAKLKPHIFEQFRFRKGTTSQEDQDGNNPSDANPEKHKMVATVLVDMRIHGNHRWRYPQRQQGVDLNDSLADTEDRLTDSEVASDADFSSRRSEIEIMSDVDTSQDDDIENIRIMPEENEHPVLEEQQVIRRRRNAADLLHTSL